MRFVDKVVTALAQCRHAEGTEILKGKRLGLKTSNAKYGRGNMGSIEVFHQCSQPSLHDPELILGDRKSVV